MGSIGAPELLVIALIALLLFGAGRIADIGKGLGQGIKNFKQGLKDGDEADADEKEEEPKVAKRVKATKSSKDEDKVEKRAARDDDEEDDDDDDADPPKKRVAKEATKEA